MNFLSFSTEETFALGKNLAPKILQNRMAALVGNLGSGKTSISKGIISTLCQEEPDTILSPTFSYVHTYSSPFGPIHHFDLYRISDLNHFASLGFHEYLLSGAICLFEWPEKIQPLLSKSTIFITLKPEIQDNRELRRITIEIP